jgi:hypothetical protein
VTENASVSASVGQVPATDADSGNSGIVTYRLIDSITRNSIPQFTIDSVGQIKVGPGLERDGVTGKELYQLTVEATDRGSPPLSTSVNVSITLDDVNDNAPLFSTVRINSFNFTLASLALNLVLLMLG